MLIMNLKVRVGEGWVLFVHNKMRRFAGFGTICTIEKNNHEGVLTSKVAGLANRARHRKWQLIFFWAIFQFILPWTIINYFTGRKAGSFFSLPFCNAVKNVIKSF